MFGPDRGRVRTGAFAYNLKTETIRQLSGNFIEPHAWLHDNSTPQAKRIVVIQEGCHTISGGIAYLRRIAVGGVTFSPSRGDVEGW